MSEEKYIKDLQRKITVLEGAAVEEEERSTIFRDTAKRLQKQLAVAVEALEYALVSKNHDSVIKEALAKIKELEK